MRHLCLVRVRVPFSGGVPHCTLWHSASHDETPTATLSPRANLDPVPLGRSHSASVDGIDDIVSFFGAGSSQAYLGTIVILFVVLWITIYILEAPYRVARRKTMPQEWQVVEVREWLQIIELREVEPSIVGTHNKSNPSTPRHLLLSPLWAPNH